MYEIREEKYKAIAEKIGGSTGKKTAEALRDFYEMFDESMIDWFAGLYDPKIGGYYYSNGAKNLDTVTYQGVTYPLLPDIESTEQALRFISDSGLAGEVGRSFADVLPEKMKRDIAKYLKGLQDEGGFFYNPQWGKEYTDKKLSRRARDLGNAVAVLKRLGYAPTYDTPIGDKGDYKLFDGTPVKRKTALAESGNKTNDTGIEIPDNMKDKASFLAYLDTLDVKTGAYSVGNTLTAQKRQIIFRDEELKREGAGYSLMDILIEWLNENQNDNGLWHPETNYYGVNGLMKISGVYGAAGVLLPNAEKAVMASIDAMNTSETATAVTSVYNTWFAAERVLRHIRSYGGEEGAKLSEKILGELRRRAPDALSATKEKLLVFKKESGSFSYCPTCSSARSQGCPVTHEAMAEGDVNATIICSSDILNYIYASLGIPELRVPIFGEREMKRYIDIIGVY